MMKTGHSLRRLLAVATFWGAFIGGAQVSGAASSSREGEVVVDFLVLSDDMGDDSDSRGAFPFSPSAAVESVVSTPLASAVEKSEDNKFLSSETVIIGCTAGATAGALAVAVPAITTASTGIGAPIGATLVAGTAVLGCAVGAVSGLAAIGTAISLTLFNQVKSRLVDDPPLSPVSEGVIGGLGK
ncbi:exported hypothetical protein [Azospirillaceae bacterium]